MSELGTLLSFAFFFSSSHLEDCGHSLGELGTLVPLAGTPPSLLP